MATNPVVKEVQQPCCWLNKQQTGTSKLVQQWMAGWRC